MKPFTIFTLACWLSLVSPLAKFAFALPGGRGPAPTATITASASILPKITLTAGANLAFGEIIVDAALGAGTVALSPAGAVSTTGGALSASGTSPGTFSVTGGQNRTYLVAADATLTLTCSVGLCAGATMVADQVQVSTNLLSNATCTTAAPCQASLDGTGNDTIAVGGRLNIGASQAEGVYSGSFVVTVQYD